jgi:hypothetical protein
MLIPVSTNPSLVSPPNQKIEIVINQSTIQVNSNSIPDQNDGKVLEISKQALEQNCPKALIAKSTVRNRFTIFCDHDKNSRNAIICCFIMAAALIILRQILPPLDESEY